MNLTELLAEVFWGNTLLNWALSLTAFFVTFTVLPAVRAFVMSRARRLNTVETRASTELVLLLITRTRATFLFIVAIYAAERFLVLPTRIEQVSAAVIVLVVWIQAALWGVAAVEFALGQREARKAAAGEQRESGSISVLLFIARVAIFAFATLLALDNLGVNITALVAGLGIGGIAIALAVQTVLGDHQDAVVCATWLRTLAPTLPMRARHIANQLAAAETEAARRHREDWLPVWDIANDPALRRWW